MKKFLVGVLVGAIGMALLCAAVPLMLSVAGGPPTLAAVQRGELPPQPPIVFRGLFSSRGDYGAIDQIGDSSFKFTARDGTQKTVILTVETAIYRGRTRVTAAELSRGQRLLVIGKPQSNGSVLARLIRFVTSSLNNSGIPNESRLVN